MEPQKRDIINAQVTVFGTNDIILCYECHKPTNRPHYVSSYCRECEDAILVDEMKYFNIS